MGFKELGISAFLILYGGAALIVWRWPQGGNATMSQHVAASKRLVLFYILLFSVVLSLLLLFFFYWFMPMLHISDWFGVFIVIASVTQYACTLIPEVGGWKTKYHRFLAGVSAACLIPALLVLFVADSVSSAGRFLILAGLAAMLAIIVLLIRGGGKHKYFLTLQLGYFAAFFIPILFITHTL